MKPNQRLLFSFMAGAAFVLAGCSDKDNAPVITDFIVVEEGSAGPAEIVENTQPTAILGSGGSISGLLSSTFTNIVEVAKAKNVIVACSDMDAYEEELLAAYKRGAVITVTDTDAAQVDEWCAAHGMLYPGDPSAAGGCSLISFNRKAASIAIQKKYVVQDDIIDEEEVPLAIYANWLDELLSKNLMGGNDLRSRDIKKRFAPQHVKQVFPIDLLENVQGPDWNVQGPEWPLPENASLTATAEVAYDIYPLHSFADNGSSEGDYYVVDAELTIHSADIYNGRWQFTNSSGRFESAGFHLSGCRLEAGMLERSASGLVDCEGYGFAAGPAPETAVDSSSCQAGFDWSFDGWLTGGNGLESTVPTPLQQGGWTWSGASSQDIVGMSVESATDGGHAVWSLTVDKMSDDGNLPAIATGDLKFRFSWIWKVPEAKDNTDGRYYMQLDFHPFYTITHRYVYDDGSYGEIIRSILYNRSYSMRFMLIPPSRTEGQRI